MFSTFCAAKVISELFNEVSECKTFEVAMSHKNVFYIFTYCVASATT